MTKLICNCLVNLFGKYNLESVFCQYLNFVIGSTFQVNYISDENILERMRNIEISKAANKYKLPGRYLRGLSNFKQSK